MRDLFYKNRRLLMLAIALIVVTGLSSIYVLPRLEDPVLAQRASLIHTSFPGANAVRVETLVTEPIEEALKEIEEIRFIRSASRDESLSSFARQFLGQMPKPDVDLISGLSPSISISQKKLWQKPSQYRRHHHGDL